MADYIGDVNAPVFGTEGEPLLCALARATYADARLGEVCAFLVAETGADPLVGEPPPLVIAIARNWQSALAKPTTLDDVRRIAAVFGVTEDSAFEGGALLRCAIREGRLRLLAPLAYKLRNDAVMHFLTRTCDDDNDLLESARVLLDDFGQDALERDEDGRTLAELPSTSPALRELLGDFGQRKTSILEARTARFDAFVASEGLSRVDYERRAYANYGAPFDPEGYRMAHFLVNDVPDLILCLQRTCPRETASVRAQLHMYGIRFDAPYTRAFAHAARTSLIAMLDIQPCDKFCDAFYGPSHTHHTNLHA